MSEQRISTAPVKRLAIERGYKDYSDLWRAIGQDSISRNTVKWWWADAPMARIDVTSWAKLADFFGVDMLDLIEEIKT